MDATLTLDGIAFSIRTDPDGDIRFMLPGTMDEEVSLSPAAVQLLSEALQYAVYGGSFHRKETNHG